MAVIVHVRIDGAEFSAPWDGDQIAAVADVKMVWGRQSRYDEIPPVALTLTLIDPSGELFRRPMQGRTIEVTSAGGFTANPPVFLFRGRVQTATPELVTIKHPVTRKLVEVWSVKVTARDPLADLATATVAGPGVDGAWPAELIPDRLARILAVVRSTLLDRFAPPATPNFRVKAYGSGASTNPLDMLRRAYRATDLEQLQYDPNYAVALGQPRVGALAFARDRANEGLSLFWDGTRITVGPFSYTDFTVPAAVVGLPNGSAFHSDLSAALDVVQVVTQAADGTAALEQLRTSSYSADGGVRVLKIESDLDKGGPAWADIGFRWLALVESLNGAWRHPVVRVTNRTGDITLAAPIYPWSNSEALYFAGSQFAAVPGPGLHQAIGGTITCDGIAWRHDLDLAPVIGAAYSLDISSIIANPAPTLESFAPTVSLSDFGNLRQGI